MAKAITNSQPSTLGIKSRPAKGLDGGRVMQCYYRDDWSIEAWTIERSNIGKRILEKRLEYPGIYFLIGDITGGNSTKDVYIGKAGLRNAKGASADEQKPVLRRLREHNSNENENYYDRWSYAVIFTSHKPSDIPNSADELVSAWGLTEISNLENIVYHNLPKTCKLNSAEPNVGSNGSDNYDYDGVFNEIKTLFTVIDPNVFSVDIDRTIQVENEGYSIKESRDFAENISPESYIPEFITPKWVVKQMVDELDKSMFNPNTRFLDPACKGGEFLREIYDRLMESETMQSAYPNIIERSNHILMHQLYGIALSDVSRDRTKRSLLGIGNNIRIIHGYVSKLKVLSQTRVKASKRKSNSSDMPKGIIEEIRDYFREETGDPVKFDVVIGNPPYQEINGGGGKAIYSDFVELGIAIANTVVMITSNTWLTGETLKGFRHKVLNSGLKRITNYSRLGDVFKSVGVAVSIVTIESSYRGGHAEYIEVVGNEIKSQYTRNFVGSDIDEDSIGFIAPSKIVNDIVSKIDCTKPFTSRMVAKLPFGIESSGKTGTLAGSPVISVSDKKTDDLSLPILFMQGQEPVVLWTSIDEVPRNIDLIDEYGVLCGRVLHRNKNVITNIQPLHKGEACAGSYAMLYHSSDSSEAFYAYKYVKTQFLRFLIHSNMSDYDRVTPYRFGLVPTQDFTSNSDIDWSQSISDIDEQLFKKYKLTADEVAYIKRTIKPMA